jgi:NADH:ubiquinone oxidoreductase subunit E
MAKRTMKSPPHQKYSTTDGVKKKKNAILPPLELIDTQEGYEEKKVIDSKITKKKNVKGENNDCDDA